MTSIGNYEIVEKIGEGGMGEVYRAKDPSLSRNVAIKVLPKAFSSDEDRLRRFELEAQAAGSLNHPNILVIYHVGRHDGAPYIVSELLEGETLRDRISGQAISHRKALDYALQIAKGLAAAHEKGIIHRDLKPENVFITRDGRVKILDFGLAKLTQPAEETSGTDLPTRRLQTDPGTVMGTIAYMSPEQVRAKPLDHRTDIFSFGVILYEMLTGRTAFHGDSTADLMSAILREDPSPISTTNSNIPPALERVVDHCLEKNREERFHSASDLAFAIEALSTGTTVSSGIQFADDLPRPRIDKRLVAACLAAGTLLLTTAVLGYLLLNRPPTDAYQTRFAVQPPDKTDEIVSPIISPDGRSLAFLGSFEGKSYVYLRPLDGVTPQRLDGTAEAKLPFWSPDSRQIAFFAEDKLKKVDVSSFTVQTICDANQPSGGTWNEEGTVVFGMFDNGLHRVPAVGGARVPLLEVDKENREIDHAYPWFLPDGKHLLYLSWRGTPGEAEIWVASLDGSTRKMLIRNNSNAAYGAGYLLYARDTTLMAQSLDLSKLDVTGEPFPVQENVLFHGSESLTNFSVSTNGVLVFKGGLGESRQITWFDRGGKRLIGLEPAGTYNDVVLSPDDRFAAVQRIGGDAGAVWVFDILRGSFARFTLGGAEEDDPVWSADGKYLYFTAGTNDHRKVYRKLANGAGNEELVGDPGPGMTTNGIDLSSDGRYVILEKSSAESGADIWIMPLDGSSAAYPFLDSKFSESFAKFAPDGRLLAYASSESGRSEIFVRSFPENEGKWMVSTQGGSQPRWSRDGRELFYIAPNRMLMVVPLRQGPPVEIGTPQPLFRTQVSGMFVPNRYDVASDGQRFLINSTVEGNETSPIYVTINWHSNIKK